MKANLAILFNLELDANSILLSSNLAWTEALAGHYKKLWVVSTHVGFIPRQNQNVTIFEIGGGSMRRRILGLARLTKVLSWALFVLDKPNIIHHMSHRTLIYPGVIFRILGFKQILWYSHAHRPKGLGLSLRVANQVVTPTLESFPIPNNKVIAVGQAVDPRRFIECEKTNQAVVRDVILSLGRISEAKNLIEFVESKDTHETKSFKEFVLVGPITDTQYSSLLSEEAKKRGLKIDFRGPSSPESIPELFKNFTFYFMGTPKAIDRAAIEAAFMGLIPISSNEGLINLTGMNLTWERLGFKQLPGIETQIEVLRGLSDFDIRHLSSLIATKTRNLNNLELVIEKIVKMF